MINYLKKNFVSILIGCVIGIPLSIYAVNHQTPATIPVHPVHYDAEQFEQAEQPEQHEQPEQPEQVEQVEQVDDVETELPQEEKPKRGRPSKN